MDARSLAGREGASLSVALAAPIFSARGVTRTYRNGTVALAPIDLSMQRGEFVALLGPSGCGKTTLLNLIAGLIAPSEGELTWWGGTASPIVDAQRRVAYVFQSPTLMPWSSVQANVRLPLDLAGEPRDKADGPVLQALALVGLERFAQHLPRELSGGMQMRASIARSLVTSPELLLMDEPFGALDEFTRIDLDDELLALWQTRGMTIVFVTHSIVEAAYLATRIVVMSPRPGRIVATIAVDAPYPRGDTWRASPRFAELCRNIRDKVRAGSRANINGQ